MNPDKKGIYIASSDNIVKFSDIQNETDVITLASEQFSPDDPIIIETNRLLKSRQILEVWHVVGGDKSFDTIVKSVDVNGNYVFGIFNKDTFLGRAVIQYNYFDDSPLKNVKPASNNLFTKLNKEYNTPFYKYGAFEFFAENTLGQYEEDEYYKYLLLMVMRDAKKTSTAAEKRMIYINNSEERLKARINLILNDTISEELEGALFAFDQSSLSDKPTLSYVIDPTKF